jgi:hypothetical protein
MSDYNFDGFEKDALTKPRDKAWENWFKFDQVGAKVQGYIRDVFYRKAEGNFAEQRGITLEQPDGTLVNVGIKHIDFVLAKTDNLRLGDPVTIVFEKEIAPSVKGNSPTKQFAFYGKNLPDNAGNKTVAQLEAEDRKLVDEEKAREDAEFDAAGKTEATDAVEKPEPVAPVAPVATAAEVAPVTPATDVAPATAEPATPAAPAADAAADTSAAA